MQELITKKVERNRDLVAVFNRYITAEICLRQGHRQSAVQNWEVNSFVSARENENCNILKGVHMWLVIPIHKHKTGLQVVARITFNEEMVSFIETYMYITFVRNPIQDKAIYKSQNMLLQYDGHPYFRVARTF
jgi:hypothetical protein